MTDSLSGQLTDAAYVTGQYWDTTRLSARLDLHRRFSTNRRGWHRWVWDQLDLPPHARILEVGSGPGDLWARNADGWPVGWQLVLTDLSPGMVAEAQQNLEAAPREVRFQVVDVCATPFASASFDAVIANHMLYHVSNRLRALAEIRRVLRPGGRMYAATNGQGHMRRLERLVRRFSPDCGYRVDVPGFTLENGAALLQTFFADVEVRRYRDDLLVTEAEPLAEYVLSAFVTPALEGTHLKRFFEGEITAAGGALRIEKDAGLIVARADR